MNRHQFTNHPNCHCHDCGSNEEFEHHHGFEVIFEGEIPYSKNEIWKVLITDNTWLPDVYFTNLQPGGSLTQKIHNQKDESYMLLDVEENQILSFNWIDNSIVTVELHETDEKNKVEISCNIWLMDITENTIGDLVNWIINLKRLDAYLNSSELSVTNDELNEITQEVEALLLNLTNKEI